MSSLIPERQLAFSPSLAATIGLEEAVLLQVLTAVCQFAESKPRNGYDWHCISGQRLMELLPFWSVTELQRVSKNLKDKGIILIDSPPLTESPQLLFAMNEKRVPAIPAMPTAEKSSASRQSGAGLLARNWSPDDDLLQLLSMNHGIPQEFALGQLEDFVQYWHERGEINHAWGNKFRQHVLKEWRYQQTRGAQETSSTDIEQDWQPNHSALEIMRRDGVTEEFIKQAIPEFVLYWSERGVADNTWNSKFIAHIRRQWHKFTHSIQHDHEQRTMPENWQPSEDTLDIIKLANIDRSFAESLVAEFVLFWRDSGEIQRSWNTKFLQHVKYQWAIRHNLGQQHAGQQNHPTRGKPAEGFIAKHTDRSWREGL